MIVAPITTEDELREQIEELEGRLSSMVSARDLTIRDLRGALDRCLETFLDLEDDGAAGYSEGGCVACWGSGEHNPNGLYPVEHVDGCRVEAAIKRLRALGCRDSIGVVGRRQVSGQPTDQSARRL